MTALSRPELFGGQARSPGRKEHNEDLRALQRKRFSQAHTQRLQCRVLEEGKSHFRGVRLLGHMHVDRPSKGRQHDRQAQREVFVIFKIRSGKEEYSMGKSTFKLSQGKGVAEGLPAYCFYKLPRTGTIIRIDRGVSGYFDFSPQPPIGADELNALMGINKAQAEAMYTGSMWGWDNAGADPSYYDANGQPKKQP